MSVLKVFDGANYVAIGGNTSGQYKDYFYYAQIGSTQGLQFNRLVVANLVGASNFGTRTISVNSCYFVPLAITKSVMIDQIGVALTATGGANVNLILLGIYANSSDTVIMPTVPINTSGILTVLSQGGYVSYSLVETLSQNSLYWLVVLPGTGSPTARAIATAYSPILGADSGSASATWVGSLRYYNQFSNGLPSNVSPSSNITMDSVSSPPVLTVRLSM